MESISLGINCYRAILAQVNSLESVWPKPNTLKQIYEELTELSFFMLEQDSHGINQSIDQMLITLEDIKASWPSDGQPIEIRMIVSELETHLEYLRREYIQQLMT
ncbi:MAG: hypothetical protein WAO57_01690 [Syntrophomonadaceae bacterium]|jgi:hypothetical protein